MKEGEGQRGETSRIPGLGQGRVMLDVISVGVSVEGVEGEQWERKREGKG